MNKSTTSTMAVNLGLDALIFALAITAVIASTQHAWALAAAAAITALVLTPLSAARSQALNLALIQQAREHTTVKQTADWQHHAVTQLISNIQVAEAQDGFLVSWEAASGSGTLIQCAMGHEVAFVENLAPGQKPYVTYDERQTVAQTLDGSSTQTTYTIHLRSMEDVGTPQLI